MKKYDASSMYEIYDKWPQIAETAYSTTHDPVGYANIDHIVFTGMGGSGTAGDLFSAILSKNKIHVSVIKGYLLPKTIDSNTLVVATSISGNTDETLNVLKSAKIMDCKMIVFSSGGKMEEFCKKENVEFRKIIQYHSPRASFTSLLYSMLKILGPIIPLKKNDVEESIRELKLLKENISSMNIDNSNKSINLAKWIDSIPIIYYPRGLESAAIRFKNSFQENIKSHAQAEDIIEACHNGIMAWARKSDVKPILLEGTDDHIKTKERFKIIKKFFRVNNIEYYEIKSNSGNILSKLICLIYLLDYATIYRAVLSKIDPSPIEQIEFIKRELNDLTF